MVRSCAGFSDAATVFKMAYHGCSRPRSAKAGNRGDGCEVVLQTLWGFEQSAGVPAAGSEVAVNNFAARLVIAIGR